jgi:hypothetical protein
MNTTRIITSSAGTYAAGYAKGRHAAKEFASAAPNPYRSSSPAFFGWNDGHYDECSARARAVAHHSAELWGVN